MTLLILYYSIFVLVHTDWCSVPIVYWYSTGLLYCGTVLVCTVYNDIDGTLQTKPTPLVTKTPDRTMGGPKGRRRLEQGFLGAEHFLTPEGKLKVGSKQLPVYCIQIKYLVHGTPDHGGAWFMVHGILSNVSYYFVCHLTKRSGYLQGECPWTKTDERTEDPDHLRETILYGTGWKVHVWYMVETITGSYICTWWKHHGTCLKSTWYMVDPQILTPQRALYIYYL